ncbi:hypothetical protein N9226_00195 [bacterium]|nr:hypothetical protein [bacterium]
MGFSIATDFYDLLPPNRGGWIYGGNRQRTYFDFGEDGTIDELHWAPLELGSDGTPTKRAANPSVKLRQLLGRTATFRFLRRSPLMLSLGSRIKLGGRSLWPNMEVAVARDLNSDFQYQYDLAFALIDEINAECGRQQAKLIVVAIPYLPQVYDDVWESTFADNPSCDRDAGAHRLRDHCISEGIAFVDTTPAMREASSKVGHKLHWPDDAHPTPEGQQVIARKIALSGFFD